MLIAKTRGFSVAQFSLIFDNVKVRTKLRKMEEKLLSYRPLIVKCRVRTAHVADDKWQTDSRYH